jgi:hypothetical protein
VPLPNDCFDTHSEEVYLRLVKRERDEHKVRLKLIEHTKRSNVMFTFIHAIYLCTSTDEHFGNIQATIPASPMKKCKTVIVSYDDLK